MPPSETTPAGYRKYSDHELVRLYQIVGLRWLGASIHQIRALLHQQLPLQDVLDLQLHAVTEELAALDDLKRRVLGMQHILADGDDPSRVLERLGQVLQATQPQRRAWFTEWLRQHLPDDVWSTEDLDQLAPIGRALYSGRTHGLSTVVLDAMKEGQTVPEGLPGTPHAWDLATDAESWVDWREQQRQAFFDLTHTIDRDPADPRVQTALTAWVGTFGRVTPKTVAQIQAAWNSDAAQQLSRLLSQKAGRQRTQQAFRHLKAALAVLSATLSGSPEPENPPDP